MNKAASEEYLEIRRQARLAIAPDTAEATCWYTQILDPYGLRPDLPEETPRSSTSRRRHDRR